MTPGVRIEGVRGSNPLSSTEKLQVRGSPTDLILPGGWELSPYWEESGRSCPIGPDVIVVPGWRGWPCRPSATSLFGDVGAALCEIRANSLRADYSFMGGYRNRRARFRSEQAQRRRAAIPGAPSSAARSICCAGRVSICAASTRRAC
jgi:hypothetical protein